jgi:hypothetical protein
MEFWIGILGVGADGQQFFDVVNLLEKIGLPSEKHMIVFNGKQQLLDDRRRESS